MPTLVDQATERLQAQRGRMTTQRKLILEILDGLSGHPTAEEIYQIAQAQDPQLHLSTVYRTLRWLQGEGLVSSRWFDEDRRQERFDPNLPTEHNHFVCAGCQEVIEFIEPLLMETIKSQFSTRYGARVDTASLVLYGLCEDCSDDSEGRNPLEPDEPSRGLVR